jgi:hypothetical protein
MSELNFTSEDLVWIFVSLLIIALLIAFLFLNRKKEKKENDLGRIVRFRMWLGECLVNFTIPKRKEIRLEKKGRETGKLREEVVFDINIYNKSIFFVSITIIILFVSFLLKIVPFSSFLSFLVFLTSVLWVLLLGRQDSIKNNREGLYLAPFQIQVLRVAVSLGIGQLLAVGLAIIDKLVNSNSLEDFYFVWLSYALAIPFLINDKQEIKVPVNHCAVITFLGRRLNWLFLIEGFYPWIGEKLFFGVSQSPIISKDTDKSNTYTTTGEKDGFPNLNKRTLGIWHDILSKDPTLRFLSRTSTEVTTRLTIGIRTYNPIKWMLFNDPIAEICNRARASIRELGKNFIDVDVNPCESIIKELLWGKKVYFVFTLRDYKLYREGSVVRDNGGIPIHVIVGQNDQGKPIEDETEEQAKVRLMDKMKYANADLLAAAKFEDGEINAYALALKETIGDIAESTGSELYMIALSGTDVSDEVKKATQQLSAEANQKAAEEATANSIRTITGILGGEIDPNLGVAIAANIAGVTNVKANAIASGNKTGGGDLGDKIIAALDSKNS